MKFQVQGTTGTEKPRREVLSGRLKGRVGVANGLEYLESKPAIRRYPNG